MSESKTAPEPMDLDAWRAEAGACAPLDAAASPAWVQAHHIDEPRAIVSADDMTRSLLALDRDGMAIFDRVEDARFAVAARDGWPRDAARVVVLCERVALLERLLAEALDGWYAAHFPGSPRRADAENIARLRAIAAGGAPAKEPTR